MAKDSCPSDWSHPGGAYKIIESKIIERLKEILLQLSDAVINSDKDKGKIHQVL
jgi:uncharacterized membrane protein